jgi:UDP-N-acetylmuramate-alanine ligase
MRMGVPSSMAIARAGMTSLAMISLCQRRKVRGSDEVIALKEALDMRCNQMRRDKRKEIKEKAVVMTVVTNFLGRIQSQAETGQSGCS